MALFLGHFTCLNTCRHFEVTTNSFLSARRGVRGPYEGAFVGACTSGQPPVNESVRDARHVKLKGRLLDHLLAVRLTRSQVELTGRQLDHLLAVRLTLPLKICLRMAVGVVVVVLGMLMSGQPKTGLLRKMSWTSCRTSFQP